MKFTTTKAKEIARGLRRTQSKYSQLMSMRDTPPAFNKDPLQMYIQLQRSLFAATKPMILHSMNCDP